MALFNSGFAILSCGAPTSWMIDCKALTEDDWDCLAYLIQLRVRHFSAVEGVPQGGLPLAKALSKYVSDNGPLLIVDDVLTTGQSMERQRNDRPAKGYVVFDRSVDMLPHWIQALWTLRQR